MVAWLKSILKSVIEFIFPPACPVCGTPVSIHGELCADCWTAINWIDGPHCCRCGFPFASHFEFENMPMCPVCAAGKSELDWIRCACVYDDASRNLMLPFKHCGKINYSGFMSRAMIWALRDMDLSTVDIVMPVPLANKRLCFRGYNQATLLARPIANAINVKMDVDSVRRKYRDNMGHMNARARSENIHGVFEVIKSENVRGKRILLVDDVMTTGATFSELRRALVRAGAESVYGVTFCRVARCA